MIKPVLNSAQDGSEMPGTAAADADIRLCKCGVNPAEPELHACPYQADINDDPSACCDCCPDCCQDCADDI